ncbi:MAG: chromosome segregation protein SMC [Candidatus Cyclobacteriaceae bacterium M2_1C_046]
MQLAKLEIKGFKSFADKVTINFDEGITGIVGPNGCGKSNVVDAIRWVLGEQSSRTLRSDKMENVIFNGTKKRKPTQLAEVSLTFNNTKNILPTEYSQVTLTRRYYRSGESEYLLNGITCRLKDITNLFLDTGITSNSYAIIELKMVDDLLNDKDNSRRGLFEEAAGISKFKKRKKETLKKLEDTDADLERVEDLLFEVDKNMKSLERQAKQTEKYYSIKEEYKAKSIDLALVSVSRQTGNFQRLKKEIEAENDRKLSLNKQIAEVEAALQKSKADLVHKEKALSSRQKALNEHVHKIRQYESEKKIKNERLRYLNDKSDNLREQLIQDKKSNERAQFSIDSLTKEKDSAEKIFREIEQKVEVLREEYQQQKSKTSSLQADVEALRQVHRNQQNEVYQLRKSVEIKEVQLSSLKQELEKAASDTTEKSASLQEFEHKIEHLQEELNQKNSQLAKLKNNDEDIQRRINNTEKTIEVVREEHTMTARKLDARQNEYNLTKSLVENLEGFPEAIRFLKKKAGWKKNAPLLSDILTCDEAYRVAIENYLEQFLNYYIVESEADAYEAINILSDAAKGKAHFFILDKFEKFTSADSKLYDNAFPATEIIEYDTKYRKLMSYILDGVYIYEGDYLKIPQDGSTFITKNGKITHRKFSISGGSVGLFEGKKIGRAKNLEKLEKEIKVLTKKKDEVQQTLQEKQKELENLKTNRNRDALEQLKDEISQINEEYVSYKTKQEQFSSMISASDMKKEDIMEKIQELTEEISEAKPAAESMQKELTEGESKLASMEDDLAEQNEMLSEKSSAYNEQNIFFHQQENRVKSLAQEIEYKQEAYVNSKQRIEKNDEQLKQNEVEIKELLAKAETNDDELVEMYDEKESIETGVNEAEKEYYAHRGDIDKFEKQEREIQRSREGIDALLMELQNSLNDAKLEMNAVKERLSVEFNVNMEEVLADEENQKRLETLEEDELRNEVERFKDRMERMGPINPMAMEAYNEIKERFDFITGQKEDLVKAKESLVTTIGEIDSAAKETFLGAFNNIKENFIKVFRSLFTEEDDCDLRLTDPDNPLESSIEIMAKPKGKRPLTINQLSGGEKTLTATSLLFAIYLIKPAPFCIFDEVDAPLDDANIDKFNNIIRTFSKDSQFIIVTHNKRTMASTDIIYGITMIEQGVSRVVPVDMRELAD